MIRIYKMKNLFSRARECYNKNMRFLGINGSYRKYGLNAKMLNFLKKEFLTQDYNFEIVHLVDFNIKHCRACLSDDLKLCKPEKCFEEGDDFELLVSKMIKSQGIVFSTPAYWYAPSAIMWNLIERMTSLENTETKFLDGKPAGVIAATGEDGAQSAISSLVVPLIHMGMFIVPFGMTYYSGKEDDPETEAYLRRLAKNLVFSAKKIPPYCWWKNKEEKCLS